MKRVLSGSRTQRSEKARKDLKRHVWDSSGMLEKFQGNLLFLSEIQHQN